MDKVNFQGTGNRSVKIPKATMIHLNNVPITRVEIRAFLQRINLDIIVEMSPRRYTDRWGTCFMHKNLLTTRVRTARIILYRHSVWVFLHELAHAKNFLETGKWGHGKVFGEYLKNLYEEWEKGETYGRGTL